jgi:predicted kinase
MAGYPAAGKSYIVNKILAQFQDAIVISMKDYRTEDYDKLSEEDKKEVNIAGWECSLDDLSEKMKDKDSLIIYDTACANYEKMSDYFIEAKKIGHKVVYAFINAPLSVCKMRSGNNWLPEGVVSRYKDNFCENIPKFKKLANKFITINNNSGDVPDISRLIAEIDNDRVHQSK